MKKKESPYIDGLDQIDIKNIESFPCFWQQCFLKRFFKKLQDENIEAVCPSRPIPNIIASK